MKCLSREGSLPTLLLHLFLIFRDQAKKLKKSKYFCALFNNVSFHDYIHRNLKRYNILSADARGLIVANITDLNSNNRIIKTTKHKNTKIYVIHSKFDYIHSRKMIYSLF